MRVIEPGYELIRPQSLSQQERQAILLQIEDAARTCYKSTAKNKSPRGDGEVCRFARGRRA